MQLARIKVVPEKKRCWYSISQLQCSCSRHPLFHSTPLILLLAPPAARLKAEWKGFPRGSRAKTLEQDKIGRGWIPSCYICPGSHPYLCPLSLPSTLNRAPNLLPMANTGSACCQLGKVRSQHFWSCAGYERWRVADSSGCHTTTVSDALWWPTLSKL